MGLGKLFKNLYMLTQIDLTQFRGVNVQNIYSHMNAMMDNVVYELPEHLQAISKPKIKDFDSTIDALLNSRASFCRFGDGELLLISGSGIGFQKADPALATRLSDILTSERDDIFIGINYQYYYADLSNFLDYGKFVYRTRIHEIRSCLNALLVPGKQYYAAGVTSAYVIYKDYDFESHFYKLRTLWCDKDIVVICGDRVFKEIEYSIFDNSGSIEFQYAPTMNAFDSYDSIVGAAKNHSKDKLVVCILGPTAKVLAYDLAMCGYRALDLGHIAKDYDAYMKCMPKNKKTIGDFFKPD